MKLYNTMSMQKEEFVPIEPGKVRMYACGPTVYNYIHVGNARPIIMFDVLRRYLEYRGYKVTFVQNFTDVDDKIIKRANEEHATSQEISEKYIEEYFKDAHGLGVRDATVHPKATENIQQIIDLITTLIDKGYAYEVNGDVYYRTLKFKDYGKLSHQPIEDLQSGARIDVNDIKENPLDFALWKAAKPGEPSWDSPWGKGRPGWHIECSAMSEKYIPLPLDMATLLKKAVQSHPDGEKYLLTGKNVPMEPRTLQYQYQVLLKATGIPYRNFHVLRHTYASRCVERGVDVKSLSEMLGHTDVRTTLQVYVHSSLEHKMRVIQSICFLAPVLDPDCSPSPSPSDHPEAPRYQQLLTTLSQMG